MSWNKEKLAENERMRKFYNNMISNKCYTKGVKDSKTKERVLATRRENYFNPDDCYFSYVDDLPLGTCYVDAE